MHTVRFFYDYYLPAGKSAENVDSVVTVEVEEGSLLYRPENPVVEGYEFVSWVAQPKTGETTYDIENLEPFLFASTAIFFDINLYAYYMPVESNANLYTVEAHGQSQPEFFASKTFKYGEEYHLPRYDVVEDGVLYGWYAIDLESHDVEMIPFDGTFNYTSDVELYGLYEKGFLSGAELYFEDENGASIDMTDDGVIAKFNNTTREYKYGYATEDDSKMVIHLFAGDVNSELTKAEYELELEFANSTGMPTGCVATFRRDVPGYGTMYEYGGVNGASFAATTKPVEAIEGIADFVGTWENENGSIVTITADGQMTLVMAESEELYDTYGYYLEEGAIYTITEDMIVGNAINFTGEYFDKVAFDNDGTMYVQFYGTGSIADLVKQGGSSVDPVDPQDPETIEIPAEMQGLWGEDLTFTTIEITEDTLVFTYGNVFYSLPIASAEEGVYTFSNGDENMSVELSEGNIVVTATNIAEAASVYHVEITAEWLGTFENDEYTTVISSADDIVVAAKGDDSIYAAGTYAATRYDASKKTLYIEAEDNSVSYGEKIKMAADGRIYIETYMGESDWMAKEGTTPVNPDQPEEPEAPVVPAAMVGNWTDEYGTVVSINADGTGYIEDEYAVGNGTLSLDSIEGDNYTFKIEEDMGYGSLTVALADEGLEVVEYSGNLINGMGDLLTLIHVEGIDEFVGTWKNANGSIVTISADGRLTVVMDESEELYDTYGYFLDSSAIYRITEDMISGNAINFENEYFDKIAFNNDGAMYVQFEYAGSISGLVKQGVTPVDPEEPQEPEAPAVPAAMVGNWADEDETVFISIKADGTGSIKDGYDYYNHEFELSKIEGIAYTFKISEDTGYGYITVTLVDGELNVIAFDGNMVDHPTGKTLSLMNISALEAFVGTWTNSYGSVVTITADGKLNIAMVEDEDVYNTYGELVTSDEVYLINEDMIQNGKIVFEDEYFEEIGLNGDGSMYVDFGYIGYIDGLVKEGTTPVNPQEPQEPEETLSLPAELLGEWESEAMGTTLSLGAEECSITEFDQFTFSLELIAIDGNEYTFSFDDGSASSTLVIVYNVLEDFISIVSFNGNDYGAILADDAYTRVASTPATQETILHEYIGTHTDSINDVTFDITETTIACYYDDELFATLTMDHMTDDGKMVLFSDDDEDANYYIVTVTAAGLYLSVYDKETESSASYWETLMNASGACSMATEFHITK